jgi:hypothetical protein
MHSCLLYWEVDDGFPTDSVMPEPDAEGVHDTAQSLVRYERLTLLGLEMQRFFQWLTQTPTFPPPNTKLVFDYKCEPLDLQKAHDHPKTYVAEKWRGDSAVAVVEDGDMDMPPTPEELAQPDGEHEADEPVLLDEVSMQHVTNLCNDACFKLILILQLIASWLLKLAIC